MATDEEALTPQKTIGVPVRALVEHTLRSGDLTLDSWSPNRPIDGIRGHQRVQKSRPAEYTKEVSLSHRIEMGDTVVELAGRVDGIYRYPDRVIIDEIKTTAGNLEQIARAENPCHWGQAKCYAYIYAHQNGLDEIDVQLTYHHIESRETQEILAHFTAAQLEVFFLDLVERYVQWIEAVEAWRVERDESLRALTFPFASYRPGQRPMAVEVYRTLKASAQLTVQAPTGIGKTMAVLFPSLKALAEEPFERLLYLTARTTGKAIVENSLETLREAGLKAKSVTLTAKDKICFNPDKSCRGEECEFARGFYDRIDDAMKELFHHDGFHREPIEEIARKHQVCPFELSLELTLWADVVIGDYNYAFDPSVHLRRLFEGEGGANAFLIDEAHNLVDRARDMFSAELRKEELLTVRRHVKTLRPEVYKSLGRVNTLLLQARKRCEEAGSWLAQKEPPEYLYPSLTRFLRATEHWLTTDLPASPSVREELLDLYFQVSRFMRVAEGYDDSYSTCLETEGRDLRLKLFCKDPSSQLKEALKRSGAAVFFSATLTPASYFQKIFGCDETVKELLLPSPFPKEKLCLLVSDRISTLYRQREGTKERVARELIELVDQRRGNYLLFFPSYAYMTMVHSLVSRERPEMNILIQAPDMREEERDAFLAKFRADNGQTLIGFAVMGGVFGEGIDLVGDRLTGAAVVGVGLPAISPERELIKEHFDRNGVGFEYAYVFPGINRVLQAAGRVIRSELDRGAVLLIDQRFGNARYRALFPREWQPIFVRDEKHLRRSLDDFWNEIGHRDTETQRETSRK